MRNIKGYNEHLRESKEKHGEDQVYNGIVYNQYHRGLDSLKAALKEGLDPDTVDVHGKSLLNGIISAARLFDKKEMIELLIKAGADPNLMTRVDQYYKDSVSPLMNAVGNMHRDLVKVLLDGGADPNLPGMEKGTMPITLAVFNEDIETLRLLIDAGAKADIIDSISGTLLQVYFREILNPYWAWVSVNYWKRQGLRAKPEILKMLIKAGADPNAFSEGNKIRPILSSVKTNYHRQDSRIKKEPPILGNVEALLQGGADPNVEDSVRMTPLSHACEFNNRPIVKALLEAGAYPDSVALIEARNKSAIVRDLLQAGADPNPMWKNGEPVIKAWVSWEYRNSVKELIKAGADPSAAFDSTKEMENFFGGKTSWVPKQAMEKLKKRDRSIGAFGRF